MGYILSEDPTYITNHNNARALIRKADRDELLQTPDSCNGFLLYSVSTGSRRLYLLKSPAQIVQLQQIDGQT